MTSPRPPHEADTIAAQGIPQPEPDPELERTEIMGSQPTEVRLDATPLADGGFADRYEDVRLLGEGGMGEVRLCRDRRIGREVAMKLLRAGVGSRSDVRARFEREARVQGQLEHPSVVPVYDLGIGPTASAFFTMKRLRGATLAQVLEGLRRADTVHVAQYGQRRLLTAFGSVCVALAFAHARGVLHRDLKPSNIMLGEFGEVHILDWGLAKVAGAAEPMPEGVLDNEIGKPSDEDQTAPGMVMGTPGYMAPEQVAGEALDARADVYALGAILFEILTLEPLVPRGALQEVLDRTVRGPDARASLRTQERNVPPELEEICVRATARSPDDRYASARELHEAIERYLDGDRDLEKRRELASRHAASAEEAVALALGSGEPARERARAMRELGAALALDPQHAGAMRALVRLLVEVPATLPDEARDEYEAANRAKAHAIMRTVPFGYMIWLVFTLPMLALGIRSRLTFALECGLILGGVFAAWWAGRQREPGPVLLGTYLFSALALAVLHTFLGPLVTVPALTAAMATSFLAFGEPSHRRVVVFAGIAAMAVPFLLQLAGWLPPSYLFEGDRIVILANLTWFPAPMTGLYWLTTSIATIVGPAIILAHARDTVGAAERRLFLHAWHLRQLVPQRADVVVS